MVSFVDPTSILKNPQIRTGRRGSGVGVGLVFDLRRTLQVQDPSRAMGAGPNEGSWAPRASALTVEIPTVSRWRTHVVRDPARTPQPAWRSCLASFLATSPTSGQLRGGDEAAGRGGAPDTDGVAGDRGAASCGIQMVREDEILSSYRGQVR